MAVKDYYVLRWPIPYVPTDQRKRYWEIVVELGLKRKDKELEAGLNIYGGKLPRVRPSTRKRRRSAMTPDGKGDPNAKYLTPGHELSRVRSLLAGRALADRGLFFWRFDPNSPDGSFFTILDYHRQRGKRFDVIGLSPKGIAWVKAQADKQIKKLIPIEQPPANTEFGPLPLFKEGKQTTKYIDIMTDVTKREIEQAIREGRFSGWRTSEQLLKAMRRPTSTVNTQVINPSQVNVPVNSGVNNTVLNYTFRQSTKPPPANTIWQTAKNWWRKFKVTFNI